MTTNDYRQLKAVSHLLRVGHLSVVLFTFEKVCQINFVFVFGVFEVLHKGMLLLDAYIYSPT